MTIYKLKASNERSCDHIVLSVTGDPFTLQAQINAFIKNNNARLDSMFIAEYADETTKDEDAKTYGTKEWLLKELPSTLAVVAQSMQSLNVQVAALNAQVFPKAKEEETPA